MTLFPGASWLVRGALARTAGRVAIGYDRPGSNLIETELMQ